MSRAVLLALLGMISMDIIFGPIDQFGVHLEKVRGVKMAVSVLIVDDYAPWRNQLRSLLKKHSEWRIIGEACDGKQAIEKAVQMQPDVILLDVGIPSLNGIEAAKIIKQRCPESRVVFVTGNGDTDIRHTAMGIGDGYVLELDAACELVNTIAKTLLTRPLHA